ncbi:protein FAM98B [Latimeria chalumnae]|nr:PREDICTED: protein FAM98B [Latimeria chalumnae]|eukprot:XP_005993024.1 PREDICTED: protein FAM98B [Latimeria chalumnae]
MELEILDSLEALGYTGPLLDEQALLKATENGVSSQEFTELCAWLASQIKLLCNLEETVTPITGEDDIENFQIEVSGFLKEMSCPYSTLITGDVKDRLKKKEDCLKLLLYLSSELQARQIFLSKRSPGLAAKGLNETYQDLKSICSTLDLPQPIVSDIPQLFNNIETKVKAILSQVPKDHVGKPLFKVTLGPDQWEKLNSINSALAMEYKCRRRMLIKRLDVTVQSFGWSERAKVQTDTMAKVYQPKRYTLSLNSTITLAHLLSAREDVSKIIKTSSGSSRENTVCAVNKVLMGRVPDRGGRPSEIEAPPPEMPPWQKRQEGGGRGGWGGGRGGGGGGGRGGGGGFRGRGDHGGRGGHGGRGAYGNTWGYGGGGYRRY